MWYNVMMIQKTSSQQKRSQLQNKPASTLLTLLLLVTGLSVLMAPTVWAQATQPVTSTVTADQVDAVARELWCPLCSGVRLDVCELKACGQMREEIALKLASGENSEQIKAYFFERYGAQVLGKPPFQGFNWLAWLMPFAVLLGGAVFVVVRSRNLFRPAARPVIQSDVAPAAKAEDDPYTRQLEEELKDYDQ